MLTHSKYFKHPHIKNPSLISYEIFSFTTHTSFLPFTHHRIKNPSLIYSRKVTAMLEKRYYPEIACVAEKVKVRTVKSAHEPSGPIRPKLISEFRGTKMGCQSIACRVTPSIKFAGTHLYTWAGLFESRLTLTQG